MKKLLYIIFFVSIVSQGQNLAILERLRLQQSGGIVTPPSEGVKAFVGAYGFGKDATGGRSGSVIKVTNTNASGSGSLRAALEASGDRIIVPTVGGTIDLAGSNIYVYNGNVTLVGQTAPGDGLLVKGGMISFQCSNVIVRYIRIRGGTGMGDDYDCLNFTAFSGGNYQDFIADHVSLSWAKDENFDVHSAGTGTVKNVTIQNSIISEATYGMLMNSTPNPNVTKVSILRNYFALNSERSSNANYAKVGEMFFEFTNNIIHGFRAATEVSFGSTFTVLNNKYQQSSDIGDSWVSAGVDAGAYGPGNLSDTYAYITGNIVPGGFTQYTSNINSYIESTPFDTSGFTAIPASSLAASILPTVGCSLSRDAVDTRVIQRYYDGDGSIATTGTYPTISSGTYPTDANNDGVSDSWAAANMGGASATDISPSGYPWREVYWNSLTN